MSAVPETFLLRSRSSGTMSTNTRRLRYGIRRFERWFDKHFGWYFTNGMKNGPRVEPERKPPPELHVEQPPETVR